MTHSSHQGTVGKRTQKKLLIAFGLVTLVFVILFLVILPYKFYKRDINDARHNAQNISKLIRTGVLSHMTEDANPKSMTKTSVTKPKAIHSFFCVLFPAMP